MESVGKLLYAFALEIHQSVYAFNLSEKTLLSFSLNATEPIYPL